MTQQTTNNEDSPPPAAVRRQLFRTEALARYRAPLELCTPHVLQRWRAAPGWLGTLILLMLLLLWGY